MVNFLRRIALRAWFVEPSRGVHVMGTRMASGYEPPSMAMRGPDA